METYRSKVEYIYGESNARKQPHQHNNRCFPFVVAVFVISGKYICYCDGNTLIADEGETLVVPEYVLHNIEMKEAGKLSWAHIRAHISGGDVLSGIKTPFVVGKEHSGEIRYLIENLVEKENDDCPLCQLYEQMYISKFFIEVMMNVDVVRNAEPVWITDIKEYITENISDKFTISGLAARCCMSESTFCHKFKQETGISPIRYILLQKINESLPMLSEHQTLRNISEKLNFSNEYYYSKQFKRITGITPTEYVKGKNIT